MEIHIWFGIQSGQIQIDMQLGKVWLYQKSASYRIFIVQIYPNRLRLVIGYFKELPNVF